MKRLILIFLCLLLLCGCGTPGESSLPSTGPLPAATDAPTEPAGLYDPESELEASTSGALKVYPLNRADTQSIIPFGDALLLFNTRETTTLTKLSGDTLVPTATVTLDFAISSEDPAVQVSQKGVTYYDSLQHELVFLDTNLKEANRVSMPEDITGTPALSKDRKTLYYFTADALRVLDLESGIDRLLKEMSFGYQFVTALHCNDSILECSTGGEDGSRQMFLSVSTGVLLYESADHITLTTEADLWVALHQDGSYEEKLIGTGADDIRMLHIPDHEAAAFPVLQQNGIVTATTQDNRVTLDYYDLTDGTHPYNLELPGGYYPGYIVADEDNSRIWLLFYDESYGCDILCRWDSEKSPVEDDTVYIGIRRTPENPDEHGLKACAELAEQISEKHGVQILTWTDATQTQPGDYTLIPEYQTPVIRQALDTLDAALSHFPDGLLREASSEMGDGTLRIGLVRAIYGNDTPDTLETVEGIQFWDDGNNVYLCVEICDALEQNLYHELFHVIESRIFSLSSAFDNWDKLNPEGFEYDNSYTSFDTHENTALVSGDSRAFIDYYSMTFPNEDRARIMEYAMMPGNENYFSSATMQAKLSAICEGLREAYGLEDSAETFLWEQYLTK